MQNRQIILGTFCVILRLHMLGTVRHYIGGERELQALVEQCLSLFHTCFSFFVTMSPNSFSLTQESRIVEKQTKYSLDSLLIFGHVRIGQTGRDLPISYENTRFYQKTGCFSGASDLTRTGDLLITSEMHYRLCYTSIVLRPEYQTWFRARSQVKM